MEHSRQGFLTGKENTQKAQGQTKPNNKGHSCVLGSKIGKSVSWTGTKSHAGQTAVTAAGEELREERAMLITRQSS